MVHRRLYNEKIPELKKLKKFFSEEEYGGINLWPSMAPSCYFYMQNNTMGSKIFNILRIIKFLFFVERFPIKGNGEKKIIASFCIDRKNHHELWESCLSSFKENEVILVDAYKPKKNKFFTIAKRFSFRFPNLLRIYSINKRLGNSGLNEVIKNKLDYTYFVTQTYFQQRKIDYLSKLVKKYLPVACVSYSPYRNNDETILNQICKMDHIPTFAMQNYSLSEFKKFNYESITYENFISDYFLLWGKSGYDILKKFISEDKLIIAGNPIYGRINKISRSKFKPKICTILLGHKQYTKSNFDMMGIIKEFAKEHPEIIFRFNIHIDNDRKPYIESVIEKNLEVLPVTSGKEQLAKLFSTSDFLVLHNTTMALEALEYQIPIFQYKDKKAAELDIPENKFSNLKDFKKLFEKMLDAKTFQKYQKSYYDYYLRNFYQPTCSIEDYYKKQILSRIH